MRRTREFAAIATGWLAFGVRDLARQRCRGHERDPESLKLPVTTCRREPCRSIHPDFIAKRPSLSLSEMHHAGLVGELAIELHRARKAVPWLDAEKRRAVRPDAQLRKSLPGHFDRRSPISSEANRFTGQAIEDDSVVGEQGRGELQRFPPDRVWLRLRTHQAIRQPADRGRLFVRERQ